VLKLVYHTAVFGPIHLEYTGPVVRVGRSEDNDLVLRHPSVEEHHCLLVFREDALVCLPPDQVISSDTDLLSLTGPELAYGDQLQIGELQFSLEHSSKTVAIPQARQADAEADTSESEDGYFCAHCRRAIPVAEIKKVGLVGRAKRYLCPKCSEVLSQEPELEGAGRKQGRRR
jgi:hypothetical protein